MHTTMTIRWDGSVPGLSDHRLSLTTWLEPLNLLLQSVRRTASRMISDALDDSEMGSRGGRNAREAAQLDLQISALRDGCVELELTASYIGLHQLSLFFEDDLATRSLGQVLEDIRSETTGQIRNALVRKYLQALPLELTTHHYELRRNGHVVTTVDVQNPRLPVLPPAAPNLRKITGRVAAVGFEPETVTLKDFSGKKYTCMATRELVDQAIAHRDDDVIAMCLIAPAGKDKVIWLRAAMDPPVTLDPDARAKKFLTEWRHTLELLAQ